MDLKMNWSIITNASVLRLSLNLFKSIESGADGFFVIIGAARGFSAVDEALNHGLVSDIKVKNGGGGSNLKFIQIKKIESCLHFKNLTLKKNFKAWKSLTSLTVISILTLTIRFKYTCSKLLVSQEIFKLNVFFIYYHSDNVLWHSFIFIWKCKTGCQ